LLLGRDLARSGGVLAGGIHQQLPILIDSSMLGLVPFRRQRQEGRPDYLVGDQFRSQ
jgi:hypothetical protein